MHIEQMLLRARFSGLGSFCCFSGLWSKTVLGCRRHFQEALSNLQPSVPMEVGGSKSLRERERDVFFVDDQLRMRKERESHEWLPAEDLHRYEKLRGEYQNTKA